MAQDCSGVLPMGPTCFFSTSVVNLYFGTLTLLYPGGSVAVTTNIVTASTSLGDFFSSTSTLSPPADFISLNYPDLIPQLEADPQSGFGQLPSWLYTGLAALEDSNGYGYNVTVSPMIDPAITDFNSQLANVGGSYTTVSDTGFQNLPFDPAFCVYIDNLLPGDDCQPPAPGGTDYIFTYSLGPQVIGGNTLESDVNFQILERQVTEQLVAAPEPASWALVAGTLLAGLFRLAMVSQRSRPRPST